MNKEIKIGLVQQSNTADRAANIEKLKRNIRACVAQGAELVVLQELHNGLYFCQTEDTMRFDEAEPIPGPSTETFGQLAKELGIVLVLSLFERRAPGLYHNTGTAGTGFVSQHGGCHRERWFDGGQVPEDAHPGRPGLL